MRIIAVEEHFSTEESRRHFHPPIVTSPGETNRAMKPSVIQDDLNDIEKRLADMDACGIEMQVLSLGPGIEQYEASLGTALAKSTNDKIAAVVKQYPQRFAGLAVIAPQDPLAAAKELERAVKELGLKGAMIKSNVQGEYLDLKKYWVIFEAAEKLGVPIYLHPKEPSPGMIKPYLDYPELAGAMWGYGAEAGLHAMRLICSGVFDKYPGLQIILGHLGEGIPFWLWRIDSRSAGNKTQKKASQYFKEHFMVSISGMFWEPALQLVYSAMGAERILFATDYPSESLEEAVRCIQDWPISVEDKEKIWHLNAEKLLRL